MTLRMVPHLVVDGAAEAIEFYIRAFGAAVVQRMPVKDGKRLMHAELSLDGHSFFLCDAFPEHEGAGVPPEPGKTNVTLHLFVHDIDGVFQQAIDAGAEPLMPPTNMFWGDRYGQVLDPFGHRWSLATRIEELSPQQMAERGQLA